MALMTHSRRDAGDGANRNITIQGSDGRGGLASATFAQPNDPTEATKKLF